MAKKTKDTPAAAEIEVAADVPAAAAAEEEEEAEDLQIESGYLQKKGSNPLSPWNKRYFAFGSDPVDISHLQALHKRNERRVKAAPAAPAAAPAPAAEGFEVAVAAQPAAPAAATVSDVYEQANKDLLINIAHATQTGKGLLFYHKSDDSSHVANPLGVINLRDVNAVERVEKSSKNRSFVVSTKNRDYHFSAGSPREAKGWVKAIQEKSTEAKNLNDPYESPRFGEVYKQLVAREAFDHAKNAASIVSDNDINSDGEPDDIEVNSSGTPIVKKRKSFFGFSAVATSHEKRKADGITSEVKTEQKKDLTHVQDGDVDALKTHESENAVSRTTDGVAAPAAEAPKSPSAKSGGGFKLFGGKKTPKAEEQPAPTASEVSLNVDDAKAQALKAVDDAVEASKAKAAEVTAGPPATPPVEKKPGFFAGLFGRKPAPPPAPAPVANEETVVVSSENNFSNVVTAEGVASSQSAEGFFSRVTKGQDKNEVEVKSSEISSEDVATAEGTSHNARVAGIDASVANEGGESRVDLSTTDESIATTDKVERKPSLLKRISGAVRAAIPAPVEEAKDETAVAPIAEETAKDETAAAEETTKTTVVEETETVVEETKVTETATTTATTTETTVSA
ncbi:hypothetical protein BGZ94_006045 [Podila epigama]|nr:hypothetical protein BGZ94_006045 [Podila epigama]